MVTGEQISFTWRLLAAILSIDRKMTLKRNNNHSSGTSVLKLVYNLVLGLHSILDVQCQKLKILMADDGKFKLM